MNASIIIRTYNEQEHLHELLTSIDRQSCNGSDHEVILVDSGSNDRTLDIAHSHGCRILHIGRHEFSFGRSLNVGCAAAQGENLVFVSGHCVPASSDWLRRLIEPLQDGQISFIYGRQLVGDRNKFSESQLFKKFYPDESRLPQEGFFCNNANAALKQPVWQQYRFDEDLTGLEDMHLGRRLVRDGFSLGYVAEAPVYHHHSETWREVLKRYEREAIALRKIMPEVTVSFSDFVRYFVSGVLLDTSEALRQRRFLRSPREIMAFRFLQFWGSYRGSHYHKRLTRELKEHYFYPK